jgi:hypothetical protein
MTSRAATLLVAVVVGSATLGVGALIGLAGGAAACAPTIDPSAVTSSATPDLAAGYDSDQLTNATIIVSVGAGRAIPVRGLVIAVATAIQESSLRNLGNLGEANDHDSLGLFQQRPSQGWGTPQQILDPVYASNKFYDKLLTIAGWQQLPLTEAAQAVQISAYPNAYATWEAEATALVALVGSASWRAIPGNPEQCVSTCAAISGSSGSLGPGSGCAGGWAVLARAATWMTAWSGGPVPYLSSSDPATWFGGYRRDCSGYASMALGLAGPGLTSVQLAARATPIPKAALSSGDLLINPAPDLAGHVVIFDRWIDATMSSYVGYEQSGDGGTHHRTIPYPYFDGYQMSPYRL